MVEESTHRVVLQCGECYQVAVHELTYAGRILAASRCTACGASVRHEENDLREAYLRDLEHRLLSKPARLVRRAARHPVRFAVSLPGAVLRQPGKLLAELRTVLRGR